VTEEGQYCPRLAYGRKKRERTDVAGLVQKKRKLNRSRGGGGEEKKRGGGLRCRLQLEKKKHTQDDEEGKKEWEERHAMKKLQVCPREKEKEIGGGGKGFSCHKKDCPVSMQSGHPLKTGGKKGKGKRVFACPTGGTNRSQDLYLGGAYGLKDEPQWRLKGGGEKLIKLFASPARKKKKKKNRSGPAPLKPPFSGGGGEGKREGGRGGPDWFEQAGKKKKNVLNRLLGEKKKKKKMRYTWGVANTFVGINRGGEKKGLRIFRSGTGYSPSIKEN